MAKALSRKGNQQVVPKKAPTKRVRRSAEDARAAILDAAEHAMVEVGPAGIRLQDVAHEVGVSHPTVLHHFGTREGLIAAVVHRSVAGLHEDLVREIQKGAEGETSIEGMLHAAARVLGEGGHARVTAWLALSGYPPDARGTESLQAIATAAHQLRTLRRGDATPAFEDTYFVILMAALVLFGDAIVGPAMRANGASESKQREESARFRGWLAELLQTHLEGGGAPAAKKTKRRV